ncbi:hypothetical protein BACCAP_01102 [Pseudoflavonifractor capillosus ATCC 29799]|uniref:Uncharacterized protein n=1 Tax=Pseudoflavonifractor capillosus ATCC 29799 TaxID=411467 RepID=A6NSC3_9FIRM|nr:hypothetical protein BACCAP_01102 [Pseudoflavonifractor capillosus ATCC 29799]
MEKLSRKQTGSKINKLQKSAVLTISSGENGAFCHKFLEIISGFP